MGVDRFGRALGRWQRDRCDGRARPGDGRARVDQLVVLGEQEGEQPLVLGVERRRERCEIELLDVDRDLEALAVVADVDLVGRDLVGLGHALVGQPGAGVGSELAQDLRQVRRGQFGEPAQYGARRLAARRRRRVAQRAEHARRRRHDHRPGARQLAERVRVQRPGPAERDQGEVARVEALLHRHQAQPPEHVLVDDVDDPRRCGLRRRQPHRLGDLLDGRPRGTDVEGDLATRQRRRQVAEHDVRVRDRRLGAAPAVRGGPGVGTRGLRAHAQRPGQLGDVRDRAAAGADRPDIHTGRAHRQVADFRLPPDPRREPLDERDICGGAPHVEGDEVGEPALLGDPHRACDATGRAGQQHRHRCGDGGLRGGQPAVAAQDRQFAGHSVRAQAPGQRLHVPLDVRLHVAVRHRGDGSLVLAQLGQHVTGQRHGHAGQHLRGDRGDAPLVGGVREGVDERDRQCVDPGQCGELGANVGLVQLPDQRAVRGDALVDLDGVLQRGERLRLRPDDPAGEPTRHVGAGDLQHLPEALRGDEPDGGALPLKDRVGGDRRAVQHLRDVRQGDARLLAHPGDTGAYPDGLVRRGRRGLRPPGAPADLLDEEHVGEGPADVDSEPVAHAWVPSAVVQRAARTITARALWMCAVITAAAHAGSRDRTAAAISTWWARLRASDASS